MAAAEVRKLDGRADLINAHLSEIRAAIAYVARRNGLRPEEREELTGLVYLKLVDRNYAVFHKFGGRSRLRTYLVAVIQRLLIDERACQWGKWRPSRRSRRLGPPALLLDRLIACEGMPAPEACAAVRRLHGRQVPEGLEQLAAQLTPRRRRQHVDEKILAAMPSSDGAADRLVAAADRRRTLRRTAAALAPAFKVLPVDDRLILRLRFVENLTIADIARRLAIPAARSKQLYSRIRRQLDFLGAALERAGLERAEVMSALGTSDTLPLSLFVRSQSVRQTLPH